MPTASYQIRLCNSCGLRYPLTEGHAFGTRCPICMGETRLILSRELILEPDPDRHPTVSTRRAKDEPSTRRPNPSPKRRPSGALRKEEFAVLLDNIRSAWNVGSIFRSADGFGFAHAYLCGITPTPDNETVTKTSLGAEDSVSWSYHKDAVKLVKGLKKEGWRVFALEEDAKAKAIGDYGASKDKTGKKSVLIAGSEVTGVDPELLELADNIFYIPMRGEKKSYNVAMAFSIAAYAIRAKYAE